MPELVALAVICKADAQLQLPLALQLRVAATALRVQVCGMTHRCTIPRFV